MYKKFFMGIAAMAALTLVSCSSDDLNSLSDNSSKNEAISFDGYLGRSAVAVNGSRGSVETVDQLKTDAFGVFGNYNSMGGQNFGSNLFNNTKVKGDDSGADKWAYDPVRYWPAQGHIDFLAYAPYADETTLNNTSIAFNVLPTITAQKDLLWANAANKTNGIVTFKFAHALSRLGYTVKLNKAYDNATITLNKITLAGSNTDQTQNAFYKEGTIDLSTGNWSTASSKDTKYNDAKQNFEWFSDKNKQLNEKTLSSEDGKAIKNSGNEYLLVIPQDFSTGNANTDKLYVIVDYTITYTKHDNGALSEMKYTVSSQIKKNFEQGKAYMINLTIGLTPIEFNADVNKWDESDPGYDITWN